MKKTSETNVTHTLILCIGNRDGGDDGIGPYIADHLKDTPTISIIDGGTIPENYTSIIRKQQPQRVILIDAVDMNLSAGEIRIIPENHIGVMHVSTHGIPLSVLIKYLKTIVNQVVLIGIQPKSYTKILTKSVKKSGDLLVEYIQKNDFSHIQTFS